MVVVNDVAKLFDDASWCVCMDRERVPELGKFTGKIFVPTRASAPTLGEVIPIQTLGWWKGDPHPIYGSKARVGEWGWSKEIHKGVYSGSSSTFAAVEVAAWLGFKTMYIYGMDNGNVNPEQTHFWGVRKKLLEGNALEQRKLWFQQAYEAWVYCKNDIEAAKLTIFDCSPATERRVFPYKEVKSVYDSLCTN